MDSNIKDYLEEWNEKAANNFKEKLFTKSPDLFIKTYNEYKTQLDKIAEDQALERIEKKLLNKDTKKVDKELMLYYVLDKYWTLYPKWLQKYKDSFLWYTVLWGQINDEVFQKYKRDAEIQWTPFTEENLLIRLNIDKNLINKLFETKNNSN